jgi:hypothetical protein
MQAEIFEFIEKKNKELPKWVAQFELVAYVTKNNLTRSSQVCRALSQIRKFKELDYLEISCKEEDKFRKIYFKKILESIGRLDLIDKTTHFRRPTFLYKIK